MGRGGGGIGRPSNGASAGIRPETRVAACLIAPVGSSGNPAGLIERRTGEAAAASKSASQRSTELVADNAVLAASLNGWTSDAGIRAPGSGGRAESRKA